MEDVEILFNRQLLDEKVKCFITGEKSLERHISHAKEIYP